MRVFNFSAGPACLPEDVLKRAQAELVEHEDHGMSVMEMSHRSPMYEEIINGAEALLRELMHIPDNYKVLFIQGGASLQFAMAPLNLKKNGKADYVSTGAWSKKAVKEAKRYLDVNVVASSEESVFNHIPELDGAKFNPDADYFHITSNNTIYGTRWTQLPNTGNVPLITDVSSCILSEPIDVSKFGILYAGAQKNIGPSGLCIAIVRDDLIGHAADFTPAMLNYATYAENGSMYNTPPTYGIYMAKLVFEWLKGLGGVEEIYKINQKKASLLYDYIDASQMFTNPVVRKDRSLMNVTFVANTDELNKKFISEAAREGLVNLKGHRSVGGMRASIYNPMPVEGVQKLVDFMKAFEANN